MRTLITAFLAATLAGALPATAAAGTPGIDKRQQHQRVRIHEGVKSGALDPRETRRLVRTQRHIQREERRYKSDGRLTHRERADLHRDLTRASRQIYRQKHDAQTRPE